MAPETVGGSVTSDGAVLEERFVQKSFQKSRNRGMISRRLCYRTYVLAIFNRASHGSQSRTKRGRTDEPLSPRGPGGGVAAKDGDPRLLDQHCHHGIRHVKRRALGYIRADGRHVGNR